MWSVFMFSDSLRSAMVRATFNVLCNARPERWSWL